MSRQEELENLTTAYYLEDTLLILNRELNELNRNMPRAPKQPLKPTEPMEMEPQKVQLIQYPQIQPPQIKTPSNWKKGLPFYIIGIIIGVINDSFILQLIGSVITICGIVYSLRLFSKDRAWVKQQKKEAVENIRNSADYQKKCKEIDSENKKRQLAESNRVHDEYLKMYEQYDSECNVYNDKLEQYKKDYDHYQTYTMATYNSKKEELKNVITQTHETLEEVYKKNIIPAQYRGIGSVAYLATFMGTSDYDLKFAIERYDQDVSHRYQQQQVDIANQKLNAMRTQTQILNDVLQNQHYATYLNEQVLDIQEHGNKLLRSINNWQKADILINEHRYQKRQQALKKAKQ